MSAENPTVLVHLTMSKVVTESVRLHTDAIPSVHYQKPAVVVLCHELADCRFGDLRQSKQYADTLHSGNEVD